MFAALTFVGIVGCSEAEDIDDVNKQTILVYMPWSGSTSDTGIYRNLRANLDSISAAIVANRGMKDTRLMVLISESAYTSKLYEFVYDGRACNRNAIREYSGQDYATAGGLTAILNEVKQYAPALNYAMIVGCHGVGWTFKDTWHDYPVNSKQAVITDQRHIPLRYDGEEELMRTRFIGSLTDIPNYSIDIPTFAQAISDAGMKMQYILFDCCYMADVEVAYELKDVTNFLLASTSEVMAIGMPYRTMWKSLATATPKYEAAVTAFYDFYSNYGLPYGTYAAIDCRKMDELAAVMRDINANYTLEDSVRAKIQILDGFNPTIFYDMGDYLKYLCTNTYDYTRAINALNSVVRSKRNTESIYSYMYGYPKIIPVNEFSGITISDPSTNSVALAGRERTSWWKATHQQ